MTDMDTAEGKKFFSRRDALKICCATTGVWILSPMLGCVSTVPLYSQKPAFRFAVASDLHYGQNSTQNDNYISLMASQLNKEELDMVVLNGDLTHDSETAYEGLITNHLSKLATPYYAVKGNHDYVLATESWKKTWGYDSNHVVIHNNMAFILADTSANRQHGHYLPADIVWLKQQLDDLKNMRMVFVFMHIPQRTKGVHGWPRNGLGRYEGQDTEAGEAVMALIESFENVKAIFHGHDHDEIELYISGGKPYLFDSHVGGWFGNIIGYRIVEIYPDDTVATYQLAMEDLSILNQHTL